MLDWMESKALLCRPHPLRAGDALGEPARAAGNMSMHLILPSGPLMPSCVAGLAEPNIITADATICIFCNMPSEPSLDSADCEA